MLVLELNRGQICNSVSVMKLWSPFIFFSMPSPAHTSALTPGCLWKQLLSLTRTTDAALVRKRLFLSSLLPFTVTLHAGWQVLDRGRVLPFKPQWVERSEHLGLVGTSGSAGDTEAVGSRLCVLSGFIWCALKPLRSQPHVHYCTNTRDTTGLPKPHHSLPACSPQRDIERRELFSGKRLICVSRRKKNKCLSWTWRIFLPMLTYLWRRLCLWDHMLQHVCMCPYEFGGQAGVWLIYWKALQRYQNSFALNASSECLELPPRFMDHDHTLFVSRF